MITTGFKICYYRTLWCIKCVLEAFPFNWAAGKAKKTKWGNLKGSDFYFYFQNIHFLRQKIFGKFEGK
jgi:hypothetical protein